MRISCALHIRALKPDVKIILLTGPRLFSFEIPLLACNLDVGSPPCKKYALRKHSFIKQSKQLRAPQGRSLRMKPFCV